MRRPAQLAEKHLAIQSHCEAYNGTFKRMLNVIQHLPRLLLDVRRFVGTLERARLAKIGTLRCTVAQRASSDATDYSPLRFQ